MTTATATWLALVLAEGVSLAFAVHAWRRERVLATMSWASLLPDERARDRQGVVVLVLVIYALVDELLIEAGHRFVFKGVPRPFVGPVRLAYHLETALVLGWPGMLAACSWRVFSWRGKKRRVANQAAQVVAACWFGFLAALVLAFPVERDATAIVLHVFEAGAVGAALVAIARSRGHTTWKPTEIAVGGLVVVEMAVASIGPFVRDVFRDWRIATVGYTLGFTALAVFLGVTGRATVKR